MKIRPVPTGQTIFAIALRTWKRIIPHPVYLVRFLGFESGKGGRTWSRWNVFF
jgi:hypothetical protein